MTEQGASHKKLFDYLYRGEASHAYHESRPSSEGKEMTGTGGAKFKCQGTVGAEPWGRFEYHNCKKKKRHNVKGKIAAVAGGAKLLPRRSLWYASIREWNASPLQSIHRSCRSNASRVRRVMGCRSASARRSLRSSTSEISPSNFPAALSISPCSTVTCSSCESVGRPP